MGKTEEDWKAEIDSAVSKFREYLVEFAGMEEDEAEDFAEVKIAKAMEADDLEKVPKHLKDIVACKKGLLDCVKAKAEVEDTKENDLFASNLLDRAERSLRCLSSLHDDSLENDDANGSENAAMLPSSRAVVTASRMARANQFHEGEEHVGEISQVVRGKFGFIVAETTSKSKRVLKQKIFFHMKDAPSNVQIGDRVKFMVMQDPYNEDKMIAKQMSVTKRTSVDVVGGGGLRSTHHMRDANLRRNKTGGNGNHDASGGRADSDNNWRRGGGAGMFGMGRFGGGGGSEGSSRSWSAFNRRGENRRRW